MRQMSILPGAKLYTFSRKGYKSRMENTVLGKLQASSFTLFIWNRLIDLTAFCVCINSWLISLLHPFDYDRKLLIQFINLLCSSIHKQFLTSIKINTSFYIYLTTHRVSCRAKFSLKHPIKVVLFLPTLTGCLEGIFNTGLIYYFSRI